VIGPDPFGAEPLLAWSEVALGAALLATPFLYGADTAATIASLACGLALIALSLRRGPVRQRYGRWQKLIV
jgi:hypothetical protein